MPQYIFTSTDNVDTKTEYAIYNKLAEFKSKGGKVFFSSSRGHAAKAQREHVVESGYNIFESELLTYSPFGRRKGSDFGNLSTAEYADLYHMRHIKEFCEEKKIPVKEVLFVTENVRENNELKKIGIPTLYLGKDHMTKYIFTSINSIHDETDSAVYDKLKVFKQTGDHIYFTSCAGDKKAVENRQKIIDAGYDIFEVDVDVKDLNYSIKNRQNGRDISWMTKEELADRNHMGHVQKFCEKKAIALENALFVTDNRREYDQLVKIGMNTVCITQPDDLSKIDAAYKKLDAVLPT